jgi:hypothetical protein
VGGEGGACPYHGTTETLDSGVTIQVGPYDQCARACYAAHAAAVQAYNAFSDCYLLLCKTACPVYGQTDGGGS